MHTAIENCIITEIKGTWNADKKKWERARFGKSNSRVIVKLKLENLITIEKYSELRQIGRLTIRDEDRTIGVGQVTRLESIDESEARKEEEVKYEEVKYEEVK